MRRWVVILIVAVVALLVGVVGGITIERLRLLPEERLAQRLTRAEAAHADCESKLKLAWAKANPPSSIAVASAEKPAMPNLSNEWLGLLVECEPFEREVMEARTAADLWRRRGR
jgi:hypothetical protein